MDNKGTQNGKSSRFRCSRVLGKFVGCRPVECSPLERCRLVFLRLNGRSTFAVGCAAVRFLFPDSSSIRPFVFFGPPRTPPPPPPPDSTFYSFRLVPLFAGHALCLCFSSAFLRLISFAVRACRGTAVADDERRR